MEGRFYSSKKRREPCESRKSAWLLDGISCLSKSPDKKSVETFSGALLELSHDDSLIGKDRHDPRTHPQTGAAD
jgi:hypothetical protein